jgi:hypothetical protein
MKKTPGLEDIDETRRLATLGMSDDEVRGAASLETLLEELDQPSSEAISNVEQLVSTNPENQSRQVASSGFPAEFDAGEDTVADALTDPDIEREVEPTYVEDIVPQVTDTSTNEELESILSRYKELLGSRQGDMDEARRRRDSKLLAANLGEAFEQIGSGISGSISKQAPPKVDSSFYRNLAKQAELPVADTQQDFKNQLEQLNMEFKFAQLAQQGDTSGLRALLKSQGVEGADKLNDQQVLKFGSQLLNQATTMKAIDARDRRAAAGRLEREAREEERRKVRANEKIYGVIKDFEKDETVKALKKQGLAFEQIDTLISEIDKGNEVALGALGIKAARAMGEVGVITNDDVKRYIEAQSIIQSAKDKFGKAWRGKVSDETLKNIKDVSIKMRDGLRSRRKRLFEKYVDYAYKNFGEPQGMSKSDIYSRFSQELQFQPKTENAEDTEKKKEATNKQSPEKTVMTKNQKKRLEELRNKYRK